MSQVILIAYTVYSLVTKLLISLTIKTTNNTITQLEYKYSSLNLKHVTGYRKEPDTDLSKLFLNNNTLLNYNTHLPLLSKTLSSINGGIHSVNTKLNNFFRKNTFNTGCGLNNVTIQVKGYRGYGSPNNLYITSDESFYSNINSVANFKIRNTTTNLNELYKVSKLNKYPKFFNFNLENNLNVAKQQR
jgi:hypothetical protein